MSRARFVVTMLASFAYGAVGCGSAAANPILGGPSDGAVDGNTADTSVDSSTDSSFDSIAEAPLDTTHVDATADVPTCEPGPPPTFAGLASIDEVTPTSAHLHWAAATPPSVRYAIYVSAAPGDIFGLPSATTSVGATDYVVTGLASRTSYRFAVRAVDCAGTMDTNAMLQSATTLVSYALDVEPLFRARCATSGCHSGTSPVGNLNLAPGLGYAQLVGVLSQEDPPMLRVTPGDSANSYLYSKLIGGGKPGYLVMPPPTSGVALTAAEIDMVKQWIDEGARP